MIVIINELYFRSFQWFDIGGACSYHAAEACTSHKSIDRAEEL